ncbi:metal ABC transporter permease, partial [Staphylococcus epidermidis]
SVILGELSVILGLIIAFYMNISPGGVIVVLLVLMLILTMIIQKLKIKFKKGVV